MNTMSSKMERSTSKRPQQDHSSQSVGSLVAKDDVRDGKFFHIRVTVGYLTCFRTSDGDGEGSSIVSAYASFAPSAEGRGEYDCATSMPIDAGVPRQNIKWPRGSEVKTSKRRLYHSILLRADDSDIPKNDSILDDGEAPTARPTPSLYATELVNIYIGVKRGDETVCLGAATLVVNGQPVEGQKVDLPMRKVKSNKKKMKNKILPDNPAKKSGGLSKLFGGRKKEKETEKPMPKVERKKSSTQSTLAVDAKRFSFEKNAVLQIKLDVMEGLYETNGPGLWGDLEDDEESFGPVPVIDIPDNCTSDLTDKYKHESIEVLDFKHGTTILASPGAGVAEEENRFEVYVREETPEVPSEIEEFFQEPETKGGAFYLCGAVPHDEMSEILMTSSATAEEETSLSASDTATRTTYEGSNRGDNRGSISRISESSRTFEGTVSFGGYTDGETDGETVDDGKNLKEAEAATSILLRYASKLGVPVEELLDAAGDSAFEGSSYDASSRMDGNNASYSSDDDSDTEPRYTRYS